MSTPPSVIVIGAGLGGLALAQGLTAAGIPVTVYERDTDINSREQGYRVSLNGTGMTALRTLLSPDMFTGLSDVEVSGVGEGMAFATAQMRPLLRFSGDAGARTVRRAALRRHLSHGVPIVWGSQLTGLAERAGGVDVWFADGGQAAANLVVGADGASSTVREALRAAGAQVPEIVDLGLESLGGHVDRDPEWDTLLPLNLGGAVQYFGPGGWSLFVSFCEREDRTPTVLWALSRRPDKNHPSMLEMSRAELGTVAEAGMAHAGWHPTLRRLVGGTPLEALVLPLRLRSSKRTARTPVPVSSCGRITLLGDAAHLMPPQRGLGANSAFEDARVLVAALTSGRPVAEAVGEYESEMVARTGKAVEESEEAAQMFHFRNPLAVAARGGALRSAALVQRMRRG